MITFVPFIGENVILKTLPSPLHNMMSEMLFKQDQQTTLEHNI
jgi:hypothetical protein